MTDNRAVADGVVSKLIGERPLPGFYRIRQKFDDTRIADVPKAVADALGRPGTLDAIRPGQRVAIAAGSRGIANIAAIAREIARQVRGAGAEPFIVPAMGSHGGATAEGQRRLLADYGITEANIGCPVVSSMNTVRLGSTPHGVNVFFDENAYAADAVILMNRIKPHTDFRGKYESGLVKQIVIGLGKQDGAEACHGESPSVMSRNIYEAATIALANTKIVFGLGIVENAYDRTLRLEAIPAAALFDEEPSLLSLARAHMPSILLSPIDVLVIDEIGKNISGTGMDPNITGRFAAGGMSGGVDAQRLVVLDITEQSHGNGMGLGLADYSTARAFNKFSFEVTYPNVITNTLPMTGKLPVVLANDLLAVRAAVRTCNRIDFDNPGVVRIKNTLSMEYMYISEALLNRAKSHQAIDVIDAAAGPRAFAFDGQGGIDLNVW